jgi:hypothetical protein
MSLAKKLGMGGAFGAALLFCIAGLLHMPVGLRLWSKVTGAPCPFGHGGDKLSMAQLDAAWQRSAIRVRGKVAAKAQPALGFTLLQTTREAALSWAQDHGVKCTGKRETLGLECEVKDFSQLPASRFLAAPGTLFLRFDAQDRLRSVSASQQAPAAAAAVAILQRLVNDVHTQAGPATVQQGTVDTAYLQNNALAQVLREFRFSDYNAQLSATNMGALGYFAMSQSYSSLADGASDPS